MSSNGGTFGPRTYEDFCSAYRGMVRTISVPAPPKKEELDPYVKRLWHTLRKCQDKLRASKEVRDQFGQQVRTD